MYSYRLIPTRISDPESYLVIEVNQAWRFNCNICEETGDQQLCCFCKKCENYMHPSCAGVEMGYVYGNDGTKEPVLHAPQKLPKSCCKCLREMKEKNEVRLQQRSSLDRKQQFPPTSDVTRSKSPSLHSSTSSVHTHQIKNSHSVPGPSSSSITRLEPTRMSNNPSDLLIAFNPGLKFNCSRCEETGRELLCFCRSCQRYMHPSCAGVETESTDGRERVVLPGSEKLPKSCRDCLRKMKEIVRTNQLCLQQRSKLALNQQYSTTCNVRRYTSPPALGNNSSLHICPINNSHSVLAPYSSSITRFFEWGTGPPHKLEDEGHDHDCMVHRHKPGHEIHQKDNGTIYCCSGCKMKTIGPHYACVNASCSFCLHTECKAPRKFTGHIFYPGMTFAFSCLHNTSDSNHSKKGHTNIFCNACGMDVNGYYYHSMDGKNNLHPCCMNLPKEIICGDSEAKMVLQPETTSKCGYCHERSVKVGNKSSDHVWSYMAVNEIYHLHIRCMIKMLSDLREDSIARLISFRMTSNNGMAKMNLEIALRRQTMTTCEKKFKIFMKYAKIVLGAIISALLGDPTTLIVHTAMALISS